MHHSNNLDLSFSLIGLGAALFILFTSPLNGYHVSYLLIQLFGLLLIGWALLSRKVNKHHHQHVRKGTFFVDKGPYEIIRHPIYAGFLLFMLGTLETNFTLLKGLLFIVLVFVIVIRILKEEYVLEHHIHEYHAYKKKTHRLIPYLF